MLTRLSRCPWHDLHYYHEPPSVYKIYQHVLDSLSTCDQIQFCLLYCNVLKIGYLALYVKAVTLHVFIQNLRKCDRFCQVAFCRLSTH